MYVYTFVFLHFIHILVQKGSIPTSRLKAHDGKIYGIDWSHSSKDELITCSLDKTIKVWSLAKLQASSECLPRLTFNTGHPVWRARDLPFGKGILSLPQRGDALLEMWSYDDLRSPVETFEGHTDVVKEFVWRTHATGDGERTEFSGRANLKVN